MKYKKPFDFEEFFATLYASQYVHSKEAKNFAKGVAFEKIEQYAQEIAAIKDSVKQEEFCIEAEKFIWKDEEDRDLHLIMLHDFLIGHKLLPSLSAKIDRMINHFNSI